MYLCSLLKIQGITGINYKLLGISKKLKKTRINRASAGCFIEEMKLEPDHKDCKKIGLAEDNRNGIHEN